MKSRNLLIVVVLIALFAFGGWWSMRDTNPVVRDEEMLFDDNVVAQDPTDQTMNEEVEEPVPLVEEKPMEPHIWTGVPFTSQAPTGEWNRTEFQDGCEEASTLMVHLWRTKGMMTPAQARSELIKMSEHQVEKIGHGVDTDAEDTQTMLLNDYFNLSDADVRYDFTLDDVRRATGEGLIIVPSNGRALGNPNFSPPGPEQHMLVITGYDALTKEFITNDPGTRAGQNYRYDEDVLFAAIREYPTGKHLPVSATGRKAMIVVPPTE